MRYFIHGRSSARGAGTAGGRESQRLEPLLQPRHDYQATIIIIYTIYHTNEHAIQPGASLETRASVFQGGEGVNLFFINQ